MRPLTTVAKVEGIADCGRGTLGAKSKPRTIPRKTQDSKQKNGFKYLCRKVSRPDEIKSRPGKAKRFNTRRETALKNRHKTRQH